jgi:hypothetical protein
MISVVLSVFLFLLFSPPLFFNISLSSPPPHTYYFLCHIPVNTCALRSSHGYSLLNQLHVKYFVHFRRVRKIAKRDCY